MEYPIFLSLSDNTDENGLHHWIKGDEPTAVILKSYDRFYTICSIDELLTLVVKHEQVGFVATDTLSNQSSPCCRQFKVFMEFGENIAEFQSCQENRRNSYLVCNRRAKSVVMNRPPAFLESTTIALNNYDLQYHSMQYAFFIQCQRCIEEVSFGTNYISLNFYYNSMRNRTVRDQLIRGDDKFQNMVLEICRRTNGEISAEDILAAEYAYFITLISSMRASESVTLNDLTNNSAEFAYVRHRKNIIEELQESLKTPIRIRNSTKKELTECEGISLEKLRRVLAYIEDSAYEELTKNIRNLGSNTLGNTKEFAENLVYFFFCSMLNVNQLKKLVQIMRQIKPNIFSRVENEIGSDFKTFFQKEKERILAEKSETFSIIDDLVTEDDKLLGKGISGKMKIIRVANKESGIRFYATLVKARKVGKGGWNEYFFEVIRHFDALKTDGLQRNETVKRIWKVLQRKQCSYVSDKNKRCLCTDYKPYHNTFECKKCNHEHNTVRNFEDLDKLPCIIIVVDKGRMGHTYPPSFNVMDLRARHQDRKPSMTSLMQEVGRMCRYQECHDTSSCIKLPYALIGPTMTRSFTTSLANSPVFYSAVDLPIRHSKTIQTNP